MEGQFILLTCVCVSQDEDGRGLTDEEIQAEANTFMFAGETLLVYS